MISSESFFFGGLSSLATQLSTRELTFLRLCFPFASTLREVVLVPNRKWGGEGLLGSGIGYGLLHRIPKPNLGGDDEM